MKIDISSKDTDLKIKKDKTNIDIETDIDLQTKPLNTKINLGVRTVPITNQDHSKLYNLQYEDSGHKGFQKEMGALTNIEIERMWNSV